MMALVQRVSEASVEVDGELVGAIDAGLMVLVCAEPHDDDEVCSRLVDKLLRLRIFGDEQGRMNRSLQDVAGGLLLISQFTLAADTRSGHRPGFGAAAPDLGRRLFDRVVALAQARHPKVQMGRFGAHMAVRLVNDGPVTIPLRLEAAKPSNQA